MQTIKSNDITFYNLCSKLELAFLGKLNLGDLNKDEILVIYRKLTSIEFAPGLESYFELKTEMCSNFTDPTLKLKFQKWCSLQESYVMENSKSLDLLIRGAKKAFEYLTSPLIQSTMLTFDKKLNFISEKFVKPEEVEISTDHFLGTVELVMNTYEMPHPDFYNVTEDLEKKILELYVNLARYASLKYTSSTESLFATFMEIVNKRVPRQPLNFAIVSSDLATSSEIKRICEIFEIKICTHTDMLQSSIICFASHLDRYKAPIGIFANVPLLNTNLTEFDHTILSKEDVISINIEN